MRGPFTVTDSRHKAIENPSADVVAQERELLADNWVFQLVSQGNQPKHSELRKIGIYMRKKGVNIVALILMNCKVMTCSTPQMSKKSLVKEDTPKRSWL